MVQTLPLIEHMKIIQKEPKDLHRKPLEAINIKVKGGGSLKRTDKVELQETYIPPLMKEGYVRSTTDKCRTGMLVTLEIIHLPNIQILL